MTDRNKKKKYFLDNNGILTENERLESENGMYWLKIAKNGKIAIYCKPSDCYTNQIYKQIYKPNGWNIITGSHKLINNENKLNLINGNNDIIWQINIPNNSKIMIDNFGRLVSLYDNVYNTLDLTNCLKLFFSYF